MDASAAVGMALEWTNVPRMRTGSVDSGRLNVSISDPAASADPDDPGVLLLEEVVGLELEAEIDFIGVRGGEGRVRSRVIPGPGDMAGVAGGDGFDAVGAVRYVQRLRSRPSTTWRWTGSVQVRFGEAPGRGPERVSGSLGVADYLGNGIEGELVSFEITVYGHEHVPGVPWVANAVIELGGALKVRFGRLRTITSWA